MNRQVRRQQWLQFSWLGWFQKHRQVGEGGIFISVHTALQAGLTMVVVTLPTASLQVTKEELLIKAIGKPGRCAAFLLARMMFL